MSLEDKKREFFIKLSNESDSNELYLIQHNAGCEAWCGVYYNCGQQLCGTCNKSNFNCPNCGSLISTGYLCNSDSRLKENMILVGKSQSGINIYQFNYIGQDGLYEGVIAQELLNTEFESAVVFVILSLIKSTVYPVNEELSPLSEVKLILVNSLLATKVSAFFKYK